MHESVDGVFGLQTERAFTPPLLARMGVGGEPDPRNISHPNMTTFNQQSWQAATEEVSAHPLAGLRFSSFRSNISCLPACLPIGLASLPACLCPCLPVCLSVCLPVCLSVCLPCCLSVSSFRLPSVLCLLLCLFVSSFGLPTCLLDCLPLCLPFTSFVCLPVCLLAWCPQRC